MNPTEKPITLGTPPEHGRDRASQTRSLVILLLLAAGLGAVVITRQSFWIDEGGTAAVTYHPALAQWWKALVDDNSSSVQMPLYMFYLWGWAKAFGHGEWCLRLSNLPWLALGLMALPRRQSAFLLAIVLSPFVWSYLDEARPYTMQLSATLLLIGALWRLAASSPQPEKLPAGEGICIGGFCLGLFVLSGSSLLGMIWSAAALAIAVAVLSWPVAWALFRRHFKIFAATAISLLALLCYYLWSLKLGARASMGSTGAANILFIGYELLGVMGVGPAREQIRNEGLASFLPFAAPLALAFLATAGVFLAGFRQVLRRTSSRLWLGVCIALGGASALLLTLGVVNDFRVLGRHFTPVTPILLLTIALGLGYLWKKAGWRRCLAVLYVLASFASALSIRLAPRHAKDDYRTAAAIAAAAVARGEQVWWCADRSTALYYGLSLPEKGALPAPGQAILAYYGSHSVLTNQPVPNLVLISRPDHYDIEGILHNYLESKHYRVAQTLQGFTVWRKDGSGPEAAPGAK